MEKLKEIFYFLKNNRNNIIIGVIGVLVALISVTAFIKINNKFNTKNDIKEEVEVEKLEKEDKKEEKAESVSEEEFRVEIKGEVKNPGVYTINSSKRVIDVINKAGGLTKSADVSIINQSKKVKDEMVIIVYSKGEVATFLKNKQIDNTKLEICKEKVIITNDACINTSDLNTTNSTDNTSSNNSSKSTNTNSNNNTANENKKISINTASITELTTLTGIGESKAKSIIEYREKEGPFKDIKDIMNVSGIGEALFEKIKENITI